MGHSLLCSSHPQVLRVLDAAMMLLDSCPVLFVQSVPCRDPTCLCYITVVCKFPMGAHQHLPSGKRLHNYGKSLFLMGKHTINGPFSMAMLNNQRVFQTKMGNHTFVCWQQIFKITIFFTRIGPGLRKIPIVNPTPTRIHLPFMAGETPIC